MNKRGFTLVELLATIVILGIISTIAVVSVDKMLDHSREVECDSILQSITNAAKEYASDHRYTTITSSDAFQISVSDLIDNGYLSYNIQDPFKKEILTPAQKNNIFASIRLNKDYTVRYVRIINGGNLVIRCNVEKADDGRDDANVVLFPG